MYRIECPYHSDPPQHFIQSEHWDVIEEFLEKCRQRASPEVRGELGYAILGMPIPPEAAVPPAFYDPDTLEVSPTHFV